MDIINQHRYLVGFSLILLTYLVHVVAATSVSSFRQGVDCQSLGQVYQNGTEWHPPTKSNCIKCLCVNGIGNCGTDCAALCRSRSSESIECCKLCQIDRRKEIRGRKGKINNCQSKEEKKRRKKNGKKKRNKPGKRKNRKRNKRKRKQKSGSNDGSDSVGTTPVTVIETSSLPRIFKLSPNTPLPFDYFKNISLCKPDDVDKIVYRHYKKRHGIYVAFDDLISSHLEVLWWSLTKGNKGALSPMHILKYPADEFRRNITKEDILGATSDSEIKTFKRRLKRKMETCMKQGRCRAKSIKRTFFCFRMEEVKKECANEKQNI